MMKKSLSLILLVFLHLVLHAQQDTILSGMYPWKEPLRQIRQGLVSDVLLEGSTRDLKTLRLTTNGLASIAGNLSLQVPADQEILIIVRSGKLELTLKDTVRFLGPASIALLMPGESYAIRNRGDEKVTWYQMHYRSKLPVNDVGLAGGSMAKDETQIPFRAHDRGGVKSYFERPTAMCRRFEMHVTTLKEGLKSHDPHTHRAAEIIVVISNETEMLIGSNLYKGKAGDIYYLGSNVLHGIQNVGKGNCSYFAFQFD